MNLYEETHARKSSGGVQKPQQKNCKIGGQCSPSRCEGWCLAR